MKGNRFGLLIAMLQTAADQTPTIECVLLDGEPVAARRQS
jgi:hypothetical protein